jgi:hypothetical protein
MQPADPPPPPPPPDDGGITISFPTVDWATLIPQIVAYFFDGLGQFLVDMLDSAFDGLWSSSANVIGQTDLAMTWSFGPVHDQVLSIQAASRAILVFALVLLGLRGILSGIVPRQPNMLAEFVNGVLVAVILVAVFPILVPELIRLTNQAATAVGNVDLTAYLATGGVENPLLQAILGIILLFFAFRLLIKAVWRIGFLAVLLPVGMLACALYAVPSLRWMLGWWARMWGGMLLAQIPSVMALTIGAQLFAHGSGLGAFVYSIAFMQLATDLYSILPFGSSRPGPTPWGGLPWRVPALLGMMGGPIGTGTSAAAAAAGAAWPAGATRGLGTQTYGYH